MKRILLLFVAASVLSYSLPALGASEEAQVYLIQQGDTLWGLSNKFMRDPHYWPDLWAKNPKVTNPHFIFPGQRIVFRDGKIEIEPPQVAEPVAPPATPKQQDQPVK